MDGPQETIILAKGRNEERRLADHVWCPQTVRQAEGHVKVFKWRDTLGQGTCFTVFSHQLYVARVLLTCQAHLFPLVSQTQQAR